MKFRILVSWNVTGEVSEQYFPTFGDADTVIDYLKRALENGAKIAWCFQEKISEKVFETMETYCFPSEWEFTPWNG